GRAAARRARRRHHLPRRLARAGHHERGPRRGPDGAEQPEPGHRRRVRPGGRGRVRRPIVELVGTGSYTPPRVVTNDEFSKLVAAEQARNVLVVASEKLTTITDWTDRTTAVLFGDGAGATLARPSANGRGILASYMRSDGTLAELLYRPGGGADHPPDEQLLK